MPLLPFPIFVDAVGTFVNVSGNSLAAGTGNGPPPGNGYLSWVARAINAELMRRAAPGGFRRGVNGYAVPPVVVRTCPWTQDGISGSSIGQLATAVDTRVMAYAPPGDGSNWVQIIDVSPNDWSSTATWAASATTILTAMRATKPQSRLAIVSSVLGFGEKWQSGVACWGLNTSDDQVLALNNVARQWCIDNSVYYIDLRGTTIADPFTVANYESTHNGAEPGLTAGPITLDGGIHPSIPGGQQIISSLLMNGPWLSIVYPS